MMDNVYEDEEDGLMDDRDTSESSRLLSGSEAQAEERPTIPKRTSSTRGEGGADDEEDNPDKVQMMDQSIHLALIMTMLLLSVVIFGFFHKYRRQAIELRYTVASVTSVKAESLATLEDLELRSELVEVGAPVDPPVHPLLERIMVSISSSWDVQRLTYLERVLMGINEWRAPRVDVCIGSNAPNLHQYILSNSLKHLNASGNIHTCPLPGDLFHPTALNWRTREILGERSLDTEANYTAFVFLEDDLMLSWEALVAWAEDTTILEPYGLKRSFFRTEVHYVTAFPMHQEYLGDNQWVNYVTLPVEVTEQVEEGMIEDGTQTVRSKAAPARGYEVQQAVRESSAKGRGRKDAATPSESGMGQKPMTTRRFVQLPSYTYSGMFAASRAQLERYMSSRFWDVKTGGQCCDEGAREFASWGFQYFEVGRSDVCCMASIPAFR
jgi:hypothetical protein